MQLRQDTLMLLKIYGGIVIIVLLLLPLLPSFPRLLAELLFDPLGQMGMDVLCEVILAIETFATFSASMHFISPMNDRVPLQMFLNQEHKIKYSRVSKVH